MPFQLTQTPNEINCVYEAGPHQNDQRLSTQPVNQIILKKNPYSPTSWQIQCITQQDLSQFKAMMRAALGEDIFLSDCYHSLNHSVIGTQLISSDKMAIASYLLALRKVCGTDFDKPIEGAFCQYLGIQDLESVAYAVMPIWIQKFKPANKSVRYQNTRSNSWVRELIISSSWPDINIDLLVNNTHDLDELKDKLPLLPTYPQVRIYTDTNIPWELILRVTCPMRSVQELRNYMLSVSPSINYMSDVSGLLFSELEHMDEPNYKGAINMNNQLLFSSRNQPKTCKIPASVDSEYMVLAFVPGPGNELYAGREEEWDKGCTGELSAFVEHQDEYRHESIGLRIISTMTAQNEIAAKSKRPFTTPDNAMFKVINDPEGQYEQYCRQDKPRLAIDTGQKLYQPHTMVFKKIRFDESEGLWIGACIGSTLRGSHKTALEMVKEDRANRREVSVGQSKLANAI